MLAFVPGVVSSLPELSLSYTRFCSARTVLVVHHSLSRVCLCYIDPIEISSVCLQSARRSVQILVPCVPSKLDPIEISCVRSQSISSTGCFRCGNAHRVVHHSLSLFCSQLSIRAIRPDPLHLCPVPTPQVCALVCVPSLHRSDRDQLRLLAVCAALSADTGSPFLTD